MPTKNISAHCKDKLSGKLRKVCIGNYTNDLIVKYQDELMHVNEEYGIFQVLDEPNVYFLAMGKTQLNACSGFTITNSSHFECYRMGTVKFPFNQIICLPFQFQLTDDLIQACVKEKMPLAAYTVIHYPFKVPNTMKGTARSISSVCNWDPMLWLGIIIGIILLWIFQRWHK